MPVSRAYPLLMTCLWFLFAGCGGGGGGGGSVGDGVFTGSGSGTGSVAFLVRDMPVDDIDALIVTIESAKLLGGNDGPVTLFEGSRRVNLLEFRDEEFLLALKDDVPAGTYDKIRLHVSDPEIEPNPDGLPVDLAGNGKIDLNPRGEFTVGEDAFVVIHIDVDAPRSVHVIRTGNDRFKVRPVIFVTIDDDMVEPIPMDDIQGEILELNLDDDQILVDVDGGAGAVEVLFDDDTTLFDELLELGEPEIFEVGDRVLVRGSLGDDGAVLAQVVFMGDPLRLLGAVPDGTEADPFAFEVDPGQALDGTLDATLVDGARSYILQGPEVPFEDLAPDSRARFTGRFFASEDRYRVGLVDIEALRIQGTIDSLALDATPPTVDIVNDDAEVTTVALADDVEIRLIGDGPVPTDLLAAGQEVEVTVSGEDDGVPLAIEILVTPLRLEGEVVEVDAAAGEVVILSEGAETVLTIRDTATILRISDTATDVIELDDVEEEDEVEAFGLLDSEGRTLVFVLIVNA